MRTKTHHLSNGDYVLVNLGSGNLYQVVDSSGSVWVSVQWVSGRLGVSNYKASDLVHVSDPDAVAAYKRYVADPSSRNTAEWAEWVAFWNSSDYDPDAENPRGQI